MIALVVVVVIFFDRNSVHPFVEPSYDSRVYDYAHVYGYRCRTIPVTPPGFFIFWTFHHPRLSPGALRMSGDHLGLCPSTPPALGWLQIVRPVFPSVHFNSVSVSLSVSLSKKARSSMEPSYDLRIHDYAHDSEYEKHSGSQLTPSFSPA